MIVIADDITGAAEIAGIAFKHGQQVRLVCGCSTAADKTAFTANGTVVIATDTRSLTESEAIAETRHIAKSAQWGRFFDLKVRSVTCAIHCALFKKTDSALRGHVVAELTALMEATGYPRAVYLPANPSKGRIIRAHTYYINNKPIAETDFSFDPEFPARTSSLLERFPQASNHNILMPDAETMDDIRRIIHQYNDGRTLFAGAADLFTVLLESSISSSHSISSRPSRTAGQSTLLLCGSTQSKALNIGIPVAPMPQAIYDGSDDLTLWDTSQYDTAGSLILTIPHTHRTGKAVAIHLRTVMARMACRLIARHRPDHLVIEGGATAWATLNALGWTDFEITREIAPGVVQMSATSGTLVTLKPGSYPWGELF